MCCRTGTGQKFATRPRGQKGAGDLQSGRLYRVSALWWLRGQAGEPGEERRAENAFGCKPSTELLWGRQEVSKKRAVWMLTCFSSSTSEGKSKAGISP